MIQVKVEDGKYECIVDGEPALIAAEMVIIEHAVYEQVGNRSNVDLYALGIIRNSIAQATANNAFEKAKYKPPCERW